MKPLNIVVTGAANGLGRSIADRLHNSLVKGLYHNISTVDLAYYHDVTNPATIDLPKEIDVLINCAGINSNQWFEEIDWDEAARVMDVNAFALAKMTQAALPQLKESKGVVINIVSNAAHIPMTSSLAYNASKAAALMITKQMAHELTPRHGITVFSISPNKLAGTEMSKAIEANVCKVRGWTPEYAAEYQKKALMHGLETEPSAIADFIATLLESGNWKFMSGCDIPFGK